jgi:polysaccharide biosynthesis protein PelE
MRSSRLKALPARSAVLVGASLTAEVSLGLYGWHFSTGVSEALLLHGAISLIAVAGGWLLFRRHELGAGMALCTLSIVALGPIGALGCILMELTRWISSRSTISFDEWYERLFPRSPTDPAQTLYELIEWRGVKPSKDSTVAPFCEVLDGGSVTQKQSVVTLIADHFRPEFAPALQRALNDSEPAIRVQAATAAARIENTFLEQFVDLRENHVSDPDNQSIARRIALHHETYARTGLLDSDRADIERETALDINMRILQVSLDDPEITAAAARLLLDLGRPDEAIRLLRPWLRSKSMPSVLVGPMAEALYAVNRLRLLRRVSARLLERLTKPDEEPLRASLMIWATAHG